MRHAYLDVLLPARPRKSCTQMPPQSSYPMRDVQFTYHSCAEVRIP